MATLCLACRLSVLLLWLFLSDVVANYSLSRFVYNRQFLIEIGRSILDSVLASTDAHHGYTPPFQSDIRGDLLRRPVVVPGIKRGKRSGIFVRKCIT